MSLLFLSKFFLPKSKSQCAAQNEVFCARHCYQCNINPFILLEKAHEVHAQCYSVA